MLFILYRPEKNIIVKGLVSHGWESFRKYSSASIHPWQFPFHLVIQALLNSLLLRLPLYSLPSHVLDDNIYPSVAKVSSYTFSIDFENLSNYFTNSC